jgi:hypothetical protein
MEKWCCSDTHSGILFDFFFLWPWKERTSYQHKRREEATGKRNKWVREKLITKKEKTLRKRSIPQKTLGEKWRKKQGNTKHKASNRDTHGRGTHAQKQLQNTGTFEMEGR